MSHGDNLQSLQQQHLELDAAIKEMARQPSADSCAITRMKKEKLRLKEEIERLGGETITKDRHKGVVPAVADTQPAVVEPTSLELRLVHNQEPELAEMPTAETAPLQVAATA